MGLFTVDNTAAIGRPVAVYLDGVLQPFVKEADTDEGYVIRCILDADDKPTLDGSKIATERVTGTVTVVRIAK